MQDSYGLDIATTLPPHSVQLEQHILGCLLIEPDAGIQCLNRLVPKDFYRTAHQEIFSVVKYLFSRGVEPNIISVSETLSETGGLDIAGGRDYINQLAISALYSKGTFDYSVDSLKDKALSRNLIDTHYRCLQQAYELSGKEALQVVQAKLNGLVTESTEQKDRPLDEILDGALNNIRTFGECNGVTGYKSGLFALDGLISGLVPTELIILGARPNMGKTTLAINIASNVAIQEAMPVVFFSIETKDEKIGERFLKSIAKTENDMVALYQAANVLKQTSLVILDRPFLTLADIRVDVMKAVSEYGQIGLVVIDYLQLITMPGYESRTLEVAAISKSVKQIAREFNVPVLCLSQLSRKVEDRQDKRPINSDLRDSGSIEQDADCILMLYRDEIYNDNTNKSGIAEVLVTKNRNGPTGDIELYFRPSQNVFLNKYL